MYSGQSVYPYWNNVVRNRHRRQTKTMTIEGTGQVTVKPDQAKIQIGTATEHANVQQAQQENTRISQQIIEALKRFGIPEKDIKTTSYTIFPRYDYMEGKSTLRGYEVEHLLEITVKDLSQTGMIYDLAVINGANRSGAIHFIVSNLEIAYQEALAKAVTTAANKAAVLAETIGATLHPIPIKITERNLLQGPAPRPAPFQAAGVSTEAAPPIQEGQYTITAAVTAVYAYSS